MVTIVESEEEEEENNNRKIFQKEDSLEQQIRRIREQVLKAQQEERPKNIENTQLKDLEDEKYGLEQNLRSWMDTLDHADRLKENAEENINRIKNRLDNIQLEIQDETKKSLMMMKKNNNNNKNNKKEKE